MKSPTRIEITSRAEKDLEKLPEPVRKRIVAKLHLLEFPFYTSQVKMLVGKKEAMHRLRVGNYRILFDYFSAEKFVLVLRIGHRKDIYR